jgi:hypothetical protein
MPPSPQTPDAGDDDETVGRPSYDSITTTPRWRIDNLLDAGFTPEHVQRILAEELDWRLALTLVGSGCAHDTALRIA